jgi:hemin uptake protein HemP
MQETPAPLASAALAPAANQPASPPPPRVYDTQDLFGGDRLVLIRHSGAMYRLYITSRGKLILQK